MYCAVFIAPDGSRVCDFERYSIQEVWNCINDMGSRWIFYPYIVVVSTDPSPFVKVGSLIIVDGGEDLSMFVDKDVRFLCQAIASKEVEIY